MDVRFTRAAEVSLGQPRRLVTKGAVVNGAPDEIAERLIEQGKAEPVDIESAADGQEPEVTVDYDALPPDELATRIEQRGIEVTGTGQNGRVLKADQVKALIAADQA